MGYGAVRYRDTANGRTYMYNTDTRISIHQVKIIKLNELRNYVEDSRNRLLARHTSIGSARLVEEHLMGRGALIISIQSMAAKK